MLQAVTHAKIVERLLASGADANIQTKTGTTALHWATANCNKEMVESLLRNDAKADTKDNFGLKPLGWIPLSVGHRQAIIELLKSSVVNAEKPSQCRP